MKRISALYTNNKLFSECRIVGKSDPLIKKIFYNSKLVEENSIFVAIEGSNFDGHLFIDEAINKGAIAIIHSKPLNKYDPDILYIQQSKVKQIASFIAKELAPKIPKTIIGVTGTDGKTTTAHFLYQLLKNIDFKSSLLCTTEIDDGSSLKANNFHQSTPQAIDIFNFLKTSKRNNYDCAILEASSHGLSFECARLIDVTFNGAIFTNISSEHLDFHKTLENYVDTKLNLARQLVKGSFVVAPANFSYLDNLKALLDKSIKLYLFSFDSDEEDAYLIAKTIKEDFDYRKISITIPSIAKSYNLVLPYAQEVYAKNLIGALIACHAITKESWPSLIESASNIKKVIGRFEVVKLANKSTVVIDFAHTPAAFDSIFRHVRKYFKDAKLSAVFSAAGQRDRSKRYFMGYNAALWCDYIYLSDEDPKKEDPQQIFDDIEAGIKQANTDCIVYKIHNRKDAIIKAIGTSKATDVVLLLAKGHEQSIQYSDYELEWNEKEIAIEILSSREK